MKKLIFYLLFPLLSSVSTYSQEILNITGTDTNEAIQQIRTPGIDNIMSFQTLNQGISNYALTKQIGNQNRADIKQQNDANSEMSNQSYTVQSGNSNELIIGQIGSGNLLLGFQLGYMALLTGNKTECSVGTETTNTSSTEMAGLGNGYIVEGERNKMTISQNGNNNGIMAIQQGSDNTISAEQTGNNNYLLALQKGTNNSITGYKQENETDQVLFDKVIQTGENLNLKTDNGSRLSIAGNTFIQTGTNLSLQVNNDLLNSEGGIEINQKGNDMKVVIDQSFFLFPMK
jgi:hypothetical protein